MLAPYKPTTRAPITRPPCPVARQPVKLNALPLVVGCLLIGSSCRDPIFQEMSDSTYIKTMVSLRRLPLGKDSLSRARQRDSVLREFGITAKDLEAISSRLAADPELAATVYRAIENTPVSPPP